MRRIIVTGATSMIGVATIEAAIAHNVEVYAIVRQNTPRLNRLPNSDLIHLVYCSLENLSGICDLPGEFDAFYHFAWMGTDKIARNDPYIQEKNIGYVFDAVELAHKCGCKKFIGAGSQAEYGPTEGVIDKETRFAPEIAYGIAKLSAGLLSKKLCEKYGMVHIWGRIFSVYGPNDNEGTLIRYAVEQFAAKEKAYFSSATQMWNYLHEKDAGMIFYLLGAKVDKNAFYRVANKESAPLREYIEIISEEMNAEDLCVFEQNDGSKKNYGLETCDSGLFADIDYEPQIKFRDGIKNLIERGNESV